MVYKKQSDIGNFDDTGMGLAKLATVIKSAVQLAFGNIWIEMFAEVDMCHATHL